MDVKIIEEKLIKSLENSEDKRLEQEYIDDYCLLLEDMKITEATANLAVKGVDIDQGVNILDAFASIPKKDAASAWKTIRESKAFKENEKKRAIKLNSAFACSAIYGDPNTSIIIGNILSSLVSLVKEPGEIECSIIREYILTAIAKDIKMPTWDDIKMPPEKGVLLCRLISDSLNVGDGEKEDIPAYNKLIRWVKEIGQKAEEAKELKDREKEKPPRKSEELSKLVEHFKGLEDELDKQVNENAKLAIEKKRLLEEIDELENQKYRLNDEIENLKKKNEDLNSKVNKANQEVDERKKLNNAQIQLREDSQASMLRDIARALKAEYEDYAESKNSPMDEELGEIYREKLKQIFKILEQKGVKVEV